MTPEKWARLKRWALTLAILTWAIIGTVVAAVHLADDEWPSIGAIGVPFWWWWAIHRIAMDAIAEFRDDALKTIGQQGQR